MDIFSWTISLEESSCSVSPTCKISNNCPTPRDYLDNYFIFKYTCLLQRCCCMHLYPHAPTNQTLRARSIETENCGKNTTHTKSRQLAGESTMHVDLARSARSIEKKILQLSTRAGRPGHLLNSAALPLPPHRSPATRAPLLQRELLAT